MRLSAAVDAQNMNAWLRQRAAGERRGGLRRAMFRLGAGGGLLLLSSGGLAAVLMAGMVQLAEGASAVLERSLDFELQLPLFLLLAGGVLFLPGVDLAEALAELRLLPGVLLLESHPPGVSLSSELRRQLGLAARRADASAMPAEPQPAAEPALPPGARAAKPPSFRCVECRRKFRLRNLRGGVHFHCPLCGAPYRTWTDAQGRVHVEHRTGDSHGVPLTDTVRPAGSHAVLGVAPDASRAEIKNAYRRLMKEHHPDRVASMSPSEQAKAEEESKRINRAYAELSGRA